MRYLWVSLWLLSFSASASAEIKRFSAGSEVTQLLELFTSEGCSSCPPADRWLGNLQNQMGLWSDYVPVAFHVDYWDYLGWRDRFAEKAYTQRQRQHRALGNIRQIYTPGFVVHGREWRGFFRGSQPPMSNAQAPGQLSASIDQSTGQVSVDFQAHEASQTDVVLNVALLGFNVKSQIGAGENRGLKARHDFIVLDHQSSRVAEKSGQHQWQTQLQRPADVYAERWALAAWVEKADRQMPLQALGGWINPPPL